MNRSVREGKVSSALSGPTNWILRYLKTYLFCRDLEMRDIPYKAEEIPNYNERRKRANTLDEIIMSSDDYRDGPSRPKREKVCRTCSSIRIHTEGDFN